MWSFTIIYKILFYFRSMRNFASPTVSLIIFDFIYWKYKRLRCAMCVRFEKQKKSVGVYISVKQEYICDENRNRSISLSLVLFSFYFLYSHLKNVLFLTLIWIMVYPTQSNPYSTSSTRINVFTTSLSLRLFTGCWREKGKKKDLLYSNLVKKTRAT